MQYSEKAYYPILLLEIAFKMPVSADFYVNIEELYNHL